MWHLLLGLVVSVHGLSKSHENITSFLTFRVDSPKIQSQYEDMTKKIKEIDPRFSEFIQDIDKLHITIDVYHIDKENMENATKAMNKLQKRLCSLKKRVFINNTDLFDSQVLFAKLASPSFEAMRRIQEISKETFEESGIQSLNQYDYHPHMTIIELPKGQEELEKKLVQFRDLKINGKQRFTEVFLCSLGGNTTSFYKVIDQKYIGSC